MTTPTTTPTTDSPYCTLSDVGMAITGEDATPIIDAVNDYLTCFAVPVRREGKTNMLTGWTLCLNCGEQLDGALGRFRWGIASGEGECAECGWPCRAHHRPTLDGNQVFDRPLELMLQYHPSQVTEDAADLMENQG